MITVKEKDVSNKPYARQFDVMVLGYDVTKSRITPISHRCTMKNCILVHLFSLLARWSSRVRCCSSISDRHDEIEKVDLSYINPWVHTTYLSSCRIYRAAWGIPVPLLRTIQWDLYSLFIFVFGFKHDLLLRVVWISHVVVYACFVFFIFFVFKSKHTYLNKQKNCSYSRLILPQHCASIQWFLKY